MNRAVMLALAAVLVGAWAGPSAADEVSPDLSAARQIVKRFAGELKGELKRAVDEQGFEHAIGVCKDAAPGIAARLSTETGWRVGRTALRLRNPDNAPDPVELIVLRDFLKRAAAGEPLAKMEHAGEEIGADAGKVFRYMKAIPTGELCLACHGEKIDATVEARIQELYPEDHARGFNAGDIRGAFTITQPM